MHSIVWQCKGKEKSHCYSMSASYVFVNFSIDGWKTTSDPRPWSNEKLGWNPEMMKVAKCSVIDRISISYNSSKNVEVLSTIKIKLHGVRNSLVHRNAPLRHWPL